MSTGFIEGGKRCVVDTWVRRVDRVDDKKRLDLRCGLSIEVPVLTAVCSGDPITLYFQVDSIEGKSVRSRFIGYELFGRYYRNQIVA